MSLPSSSVCSVCLENVSDLRVLDCLHSFCATCIDQLAVRAESREPGIECPLCRTLVHFPPNGAAGLPRDSTKAHSGHGVGELECEDCKKEGNEGKATVLCETCDCALCSDHTGSHELGPTPHLFKDLPTTGSSLPEDGSPALCAEHDAPLKFFCKRCSVAVCCHCTDDGQSHHSHRSSVVPVDEVVAKLLATVRTKSKQLKTSILPRVEGAICKVGQVSSDLTSTAKAVRDEVSAAAERAINTIRAYEQQKLQEIDDIEQLRRKSLECQREELERHGEAVKTAISYAEKLEMDEKDGAKPQCSPGLLAVVEKRTTALGVAKFRDTPQHHSLILFDTVNDDDQIARAGDIVGTLMACEGSAAHSAVDEDGKTATKFGESATFTLVAKDRQGKVVTQGGDVVRAQRAHAPAGALNLHAVKVKDRGNGRYEIVCARPSLGAYAVEVFVNNEMLPDMLSVTCRNGPGRWFHFPTPTHPWSAREVYATASIAGRS